MLSGENHDEAFQCGRLLTGSILAHEMMHAWLRLNGNLLLEEIIFFGKLLLKEILNLN